MNRMKRRLLAIFYPERCAFCGEVILAGTGYCANCRPRLSRIAPPICLLCGRAISACSCGRHPRQFERCVAPFVYEDPVRQGILRMKSNGKAEVAEVLAGEMAGAIRREYEPLLFHYLVPVPVTSARKKERGYNQAALLAKELSRHLGIPMLEPLIKCRETDDQKELSAATRQANVQAAYMVSPAYLLENTRILLIDDVITTGCTLDECARMLKRAGVQHVYAAVAAATVVQKQKGVLSYAGYGTWN